MTIIIDRFARWLAAPIRRNRIRRRIKAVDYLCYPGYGAAIAREAEMRIFGDSIVDWEGHLGVKSA